MDVTFQTETGFNKTLVGEFAASDEAEFMTPFGDVINFIIIKSNEKFNKAYIKINDIKCKYMFNDTCTYIIEPKIRISRYTCDKVCLKTNSQANIKIILMSSENKLSSYSFERKLLLEYLSTHAKTETTCSDRYEIKRLKCAL